MRGSASDEPTHRFRLAGLKSGGHYQLSFQDRGAASRREATGLSLTRDVFAAALTLLLSSESVFFEERSPTGPVLKAPAGAQEAGPDTSVMAVAH